MAFWSAASASGVWPAGLLDAASSNSGSTDSGLRSTAICAIDGGRLEARRSRRSSASSPACTERTGWYAAQAAISATRARAGRRRSGRRGRPAREAARGAAGASPRRHRALGGRGRPGSQALGSGPRPTTQPAHSSAGTTLPGTNHVQSIAECTPNMITTTAIVHMPTRSASKAAPGRGGACRPRARRRSHQASAASSERPIPTQPRSDSVWKHVAVGVADEHAPCLAVAVADGRVGAGAGADQRALACTFDRLVPVAGAHRGGGGEAVRRVAGRARLAGR